MLSQKTPRWLSGVIMLLLAFRLVGYYYRSRQPPESEAQLASIKAQVQQLADSIEADQEMQQAHGATVIVADSSALAADTVATAK